MNINPNEIGNLDSYIEQLMQCKPLKESEVKFLCEKVKSINYTDLGKRNFPERK